MNTITITLSGAKVIQVAAGCKSSDLLDFFDEAASSIIAVRFNNEICSLAQPLQNSGTLEPVCTGSSEGSAIYRRSLCFLLAAASHEIFPGKRLAVGHSLGYGYYYTLDTDTPISIDSIRELKEKMQELTAKNYPIRQSFISYEEAIGLFEKLNMRETRKQLNFICPPHFKINTLNGFSDLYFAPLLPSTGYLTHFDLMPYGEGFLLRYPTTAEPDRIGKFEDIPQLFNVYKRYKDWGKMLGVTSAADLNELIATRKVSDFINITETLQNKCIADIADQIKERQDVKTVLIAGPSSSGKTTTSKKLSMQLQVLGYQPKVIELDSYYVGRELTPKDENGDYDYEALEALDVAQLNGDLQDLFDGKEIKLPSYDFVKGERYYTGKTMRLDPKNILIMEGIHGLNDKLTPSVHKEHKFKIYLSALTQLNLDDHNRIPTSDNRLIRRIVRDSQFRGKSAADTIKMWPNVQKGERLHIFPFQDNADAMLNTALDYELAVLKIYIEPLLRCVTPLQREYAEAGRLLRFLNNFSPIPANYVPGQSLIREFIGGSDFKY
ncbi:nucleoside kinase [Treponema sp. OMZ 840]|uniref:uridine kinase family protein n=1 Tax=Treponema sp. OMZ 840 TaxID=244313 RepID=UPI003D908232